MNKRVEALKKKMDSGKMVKGVFITMPDCISSEMAGYAGYDYVWIDAEHGPLGRNEIRHHIMAAQGSGCAAIVRVPGVDRHMIKAILDMGADGIIFPFTNNKEIAEEALKSATYPDDGGVRGQGPVRAIRYGFDAEGDYIKNAKNEVFLVAQIETLEGYKNLDEILKVEGFDSLFIGCAELGRSIKGSGEDYDIDVIFKEVCSKVREAGLYMGAAIGPTVADAKRVTDAGVQWTVFGQDSRILAVGLKANLDALKDF
ncbi:MAG: host specificity protein [Lachnospiraceae bacterium]|nr:host specificity protein [Lachnospiraceae bacterium]